MKKIISLVLALTLVLTSCAIAFADGETPNYNATVTVSGVAEGNKVKLYKVVSASVGDDNAIHYTPIEGLPSAYDTIEEISAIESNSDAANAMANAYGNFFSGKTADYDPAANSEGVATVTVAPGLYFAIVSGTNDSSVVYKSMLINAVPVVNDDNGYDAAEPTIVAKKEPVTILKQEDKSAVDESKVQTTDGYKLGDMIPFTITTKIPNFPSDSKYAIVKIHDTPVGLEDDITNDFVVSIGGEAITSANYDLTATTTADDPTTEGYTESGKGFTLVLKDQAFIIANANKSLVVTYKAKLVGPVKANGQTTNTAELEYNPNPFEEDTVLPPDDTEQFTYGFVFPKTDANHAALANAVFALYDAAGTTAITDKEGNALTFTTVVDNNKAYVYWDGLAAGTYTVKETAAPSGYVPAEDFTVTLSKTVCVNDNPATEKVEANYLVITEDVVNNPGAQLPSTGGIGTTIFYILGGVLVIGAAVILIARRKAQD